MMTNNFSPGWNDPPIEYAGVYGEAKTSLLRRPPVVQSPNVAAPSTFYMPAGHAVVASVTTACVTLNEDLDDATIMRVVRTAMDKCATTLPVRLCHRVCATNYVYVQVTRQTSIEQRVELLSRALDTGEMSTPCRRMLSQLASGKVVSVRTAFTCLFSNRPRRVHGRTSCTGRYDGAAL
jgi:hypothetical protein